MEVNAVKTQSATYSWLLVGILWVVACLNYFDRILITSMHDPIVKDFHLTDAQFGLLTSAFLWSYGFLSPFGGYFADKYGRKAVIIFSISVWSAVTIWTGFVSSFTEMLTARVVMGVSEACYIPAALALIADYHQGRTRSLATGIHMSGLYAGLALGGLGGYIAEMWGWRLGFQLCGCFGIAYALFLVFVLHNKEEKLPDGTDTITKAPVNLAGTIRQLLTIRSFYILLLYFGALGMVNWLVYGWLPLFLKNHFDLSLGKAGFAATGYVQTGSFAGVLLGGFIADRWAQIQPRARIFVIVIGFSIGAPFLFIMASTHIFFIAIAAMVIYGISRGFNDANLMPILCQVIDNRYIATGYGLLNFVSTVIGGVMVYIGGALQDASISLSIIYQCAAVCMLLSVWMLLFVKIRRYADTATG